MIRNQRWKYIHHHCFRPQLFDLQQDPDELVDLGEDPAFEVQLRSMQDLLIDWRRRLKPRVGVTYDNLPGMGPARDEQHGIIIGRW